jgi:hypothetical protein
VPLTELDRAIVAALTTSVPTLPDSLLKLFTTMDEVHPLVQELCAQEWTDRANAPDPTDEELSAHLSAMELRSNCQ